MKELNQMELDNVAGGAFWAPIVAAYGAKYVLGALGGSAATGLAAGVAIGVSRQSRR
ncbi:class IIb bacteriocin, lactobin A/cerein 7B family [Neisseria yangbaofengii]|uniref:class IIb bacteriocin, lactobin A/cerein 7B family n=1 Tax=Neisseria yangbaofengii TaxID=2709396 RepID=UPI0013EBC9CD|nr:class IIb bacteriocin, lactobin A/cerein 7B family [Neisseria yangbaofengii]